MPALTIRNVPEQTVEALRNQARAHGRSLEGQLRLVLDDAARKQPALSGDDLVSLARKIAAMTPHGVTQTDSSVLQAQGRDER